MDVFVTNVMCRDSNVLKVYVAKWIGNEFREIEKLL